MNSVINLFQKYKYIVIMRITYDENKKKKIKYSHDINVWKSIKIFRVHI